MKRLFCILLCLALLPVLAAAEEEPASFFEDVKANAFGKITRTYDSPTLKYTTEKFVLEKDFGEAMPPEADGQGMDIMAEVRARLAAEPLSGNGGV